MHGWFIKIPTLDRDRIQYHLQESSIFFVKEEVAWHTTEQIGIVATDT
jgi:hypothetical protein